MKESLHLLILSDRYMDILSCAFFFFLSLKKFPAENYGAPQRFLLVFVPPPLQPQSIGRTHSENSNGIHFCLAQSLSTLNM